jgi:sugar phosphate isomerase/epimerase
MQTTGRKVDLRGIGKGFDEGVDIPNATELVDFAEAVVLRDEARTALAPAALRHSAGDAGLVDAADRPSVKLQLDQYHAGMMGADPVAALRKHAALVAHAQIADVPGRNQPGTGTQPIRALLDELDRLGYAGSVGLEYKPRGSMDGRSSDEIAKDKAAKDKAAKDKAASDKAAKDQAAKDKASKSKSDKSNKSDKSDSGEPKKSGGRFKLPD